MFKKLLIAAALTLGAFQSASAQAAGWTFYTVCSVAAPWVCGGYGSYLQYGPFETWDQCNSMWNGVRWTPYGNYPYALTSCFQQ